MQEGTTNTHREHQDTHITTQDVHFTEGGWDDGGVIQLEGDGPGEVEGGRQLPQDHVAQNLGTVIVIFARVLHKAEPINITDVRLAICSVGGERNTMVVSEIYFLLCWLQYENNDDSSTDDEEYWLLLGDTLLNVMN